MSDLLLIDDDPELASLVARLLEERGHVVGIARSKGEARALIAKHSYDLLIVDGLLPDGRGTDLLLELRAAGDKTAAMFVSASWQEVTEVAARTSELGVARVLRKPLDPTTLPLEVSYAIHRDEQPPRPVDATALLRAAMDQFREKLGTRVITFGQALSQARALGDPTQLTALHAEAHKLHGTAGSFGYQEVSACSGIIEGILASTMRAHALVDAEDWERIEAAKIRMVAALSEQPRTSLAPLASPREVVLVVEDDGMLLKALAADLAHSFEVLTASSVEEAVEITRSNRPACAFLDVHLANGLSGLDVAKALRAQSEGPQLPIIFISADPSLETQIAGLHAGGSLFLNKPVSATALLDAARRVTEAEGRRRARIVLLDDDLAFGAAVERVLRRAGLEVVVLQDEARLLETLSAEEPPLLLLDLHLNGVSGLDICRMLRANPRWESLDIVLVTADSSMEMRIAAFRAGASDYVSKPIVPDEMVARVLSRVERRALRDERTSRDNLTGLMMRGAFAEAFERMLRRAKRSDSKVSLCLLDLDRFKSINDRFGHLVGDRVLASLGQLLNSRFRAEDLRCRWGGEEFVLALSGSSREEARLSLERLLAEFQSLTFEDDSHTPFHATFSAGVASYPDDGTTFDAMVSVADARMYVAKRQGRARVVGRS